MGAVGLPKLFVYSFLAPLFLLCGSPFCGSSTFWVSVLMLFFIKISNSVLYLAPFCSLVLHSFWCIRCVPRILRSHASWCLHQICLALMLRSRSLLQCAYSWKDPRRPQVSPNIFALNVSFIELIGKESAPSREPSGAKLSRVSTQFISGTFHGRAVALGLNDTRMERVAINGR